MTTSIEAARHSREKLGFRERFRNFRKTRPFWGAILLALGGYFILKPVLSSYQTVIATGGDGTVTYVLGAGMLVAAAISMLLPSQRIFPGIMGVIMAVASLPLSNLGGWIIGMVFGIIGGAMIVAWTPYSKRQISEINAHADERKSRKAAVKAIANEADEAHTSVLEAPDSALQAPARS